MVGYTLNSVIRADGAPALAMIATVAGAVTNIILDPIFIFVFDCGISGAAWATITGQIITLILSLVYLTRTKTFHLKLTSFNRESQVLSNVAKLGVSTLITQLSIVIISMVCNKMLATYGSRSVYGANDPLAIIGICMKVFTIVLSIAMGIIIGAQPILGFNIGAGKFDLVRETFRKCITATIVVDLVATVVFELCPQTIINAFGSNSENPELYMEFAILTFRVFIHAPLEYRVRNVMNMYGDDEKSATKNIKRSDKNRANCYSLISGQKWGDPANYDLCINAAIGKEKAVDTIVSLAREQ